MKRLKEQPTAVDPDTPWRNVYEAAAYTRIGRKMIYRAVAAGRLRAAHVDGRRKLVFHRSWLDEFLASSAPRVVELPRSRGAA